MEPSTLAVSMASVLASHQYTRCASVSTASPFGQPMSLVTMAFLCVPSIHARSILGDLPQSVQYIQPLRGSSSMALGSSRSLETRIRLQVRIKEETAHQKKD